MTDEQLQTYALADIETLLRSYGKSLSDYPLMPTADPSLMPDFQNSLIHDEINYNRRELAEEHGHLMSTMTDEQHKVYDKIMINVDEKIPGIFFLYGYGGTGKTFIWKAMLVVIRSRGEIVLTVASSGIAAFLIPRGRTAHSRFGIPFIIDECSTCSLKPNTPLAQLVVQAKLIIWDEATMMHKFCFEALDRSFRDVMKVVDKRNKNIPFKGKVVVFGGNFRQIFPIIPKSTRPEIIHATINSSYLWRYCEVLTLTKNMRLLNGASEDDIKAKRQFSKWVLSIGDGRIGEDNLVDKTITIPSDLLVEIDGCPIASIVRSTYPNILASMGDIEYFQNRAILTSKNSIVEKINEYMLDMVAGEEKVYLSYDSPVERNVHGDAIDDVHTPEFFNTIVASRLPNHKLRLKVYAMEPDLL